MQQQLLKLAMLICVEQPPLSPTPHTLSLFFYRGGHHAADAATGLEGFVFYGKAPFHCPYRCLQAIGEDQTQLFPNVEDQ